MELPKQVLEAADLAEQLHDRIVNPTPAEETPIETETPTVETPVETPAEDVEELRKYKERYQSLKGKYDAEVPRLHNDLKELKQSIFERLDKQVQPEQKPIENERLQKFREEYGDDFVETIRELTREEFKPLVDQSVKPVKDELTTVRETQEQGRQQEFMKVLDTSVKGDWRTVWQTFNELANGEPASDPKVAEFLLQEDPSGLYTNGDLIALYNEKWDAGKLSKVMNMFFTDEPAVVPPVVPDAPKTKPVQEAMIAPSRTTTHSTPQVDEKRIWTHATIEEFKKQDRQGKYDSDTSLAMWNDLLGAMNEGRIRP
jgi:hypothetical protein